MDQKSIQNRMARFDRESRRLRRGSIAVPLMIGLASAGFIVATGHDLNPERMAYAQGVENYVSQLNEAIYSSRR